MSGLDQDILKLLSTGIFQKITNNDSIKIAQLNAVTSLLLKSNIPFDLEFSPGTRRIPTQAELIIFINPSTTINFNIVLDGSGASLN